MVAGYFDASNGGSTTWTSNKADLTIASGAYFQCWQSSVYVDSVSGGGKLDVGSGGAGTIYMGVDNGTGTTFSGLIRNNGAAGNVVKQGTGTQTLSGANTFTGTLTISAGTLLMNGTSSGTGAITVANTATLGGSGSVSGAITVSSGGTIAPGAATGVSVGTLGTANVTFSATSTYSVDLNGTTPTFDKINSSGTVALGAAANTLTIANIANAAAAKRYTIVGASTVSGTFANRPNGATWIEQGRRWKIIYTTTTVTLVDASNFVRNIIEFADSKNVTGAASAWVTANSYSFSPAANNLILGMSPTENTNLAAGQEGTGAVTMLTNGAMVASKPNVYTIGALWSFDTCYMVYTLGSQGYDITGINLYTWWSDGGRDDIYMSSISCSTVAAPTTFTTITGGGVYYESSTGSAKASLVSVGGALATNVYAIKFLFGGQQNYYVGWAEIEVIGTTS
jgi:autotransporter-associated beta strand protein